MTIRVDMLRRLGEIMERRLQIARELAPFYTAGHLIFNGDEAMYSKLESNPNFRPLWLEDQNLVREFTEVSLNLM